MIDWASDVPQFAVGCIGALVPELLHWHRIVRRGRWPRYGSAFRYWFVTFLVVLLGGAVSALVSPVASSPVQVLLAGMVGPQLLHSVAQSKRLASKEGEVNLGGGTKPLIDFWAS